MTKFIEYIIALFSKFSPAHQVILVLLAGGLMFLGYNFVKNENFRKSVFRLGLISFRSLNTNRVSLLNHNLFYNSALYDQLINNVKFESVFKTRLFRTLLSKKKDAVIRLSKEWVKKLDINDLEDGQLFDLMTQLVLDIMIDYEKSIPEAYKDIAGQNYAKAWEIIYFQEKGFQIEHAPNVAHIQRNINRIAFCTAFSKKQKIYSFLTQLEIATEMAITDCEITFRNLNGSLERLNPKLTN